MSVALFLALGWRCSIVYVHYNWQRCPDGSVLERPCLHCVRRVHGRVHGRVVCCVAVWHHESMQRAHSLGSNTIRITDVH